MPFAHRLRRLFGEMLRRSRRLRLQQTAASLAFLSLFAAVPVFSIAFSVLSALPVFERLQDGLQQFLTRNLFPDAFSDTVIGYLQEFADRASRLSVAGAIMFFMTALTALRVIETTMNAIWATARRRSLAHRIALYWALLTLAPLALAGVLALNGVLIADLLKDGDLQWLRSIWLVLLPWLIAAAGLSLMFLLLPAIRVPFMHALFGALISATLLSLLQRGLGWGMRQLPTYEVVYGAFAALPLLLIWLFLVWAVVLAGALFAASLRHWSAPLDDPESEDTPGVRFDDARAVLSAMLTAAGPTRREAVAVPAIRLREALDQDAQRAEQAAELLERLGYLIRLVNLAERAPVLGDRASGGLGAISLQDAIWAERWAWAQTPDRLTLRRLFDELWWEGAPARSARWQGERLDWPLVDALNA